MADRILKVRPLNYTEGPWSFNPDTLFFRVEGLYNDDPNTAQVYYELFDSRSFDPEKYIWREWPDKGRMAFPMAALLAANISGELNIEVMNQILLPLNLVLENQQ